MNATALIQLENINHYYELGDGRHVHALRLDGLSIHQGENLGIRGPNGSGKTTLLHIIAGLLRPSEGRVRINDVDLYTLRESNRDRFRSQKIGYLLQSFCLLEGLTVLENVLCASHFSGAIPRHEQRRHAIDILHDFGMDYRLDHRPSQLSTGEQQRVAAARALINEPVLVLCDEPTAHLDQKIATQFLESLIDRCERQKITLLVSSHDPEVLERFPVLDLKPPGEDLP